MTNKHIDKKIVNYSQIDFGKLPPQCVDVEEAILGVLLTYKSQQYVVPELFSEMFYKSAHQIIFKSIFELYDNNNPIDIITVVQQLKKTGELEVIGGAYYITTLSGKAINSGLEFNCAILKEKYLFRELIRISAEVSKSSYEETSLLYDNINFIENEIDRIYNVLNSNKNNKIYKDIVKSSIDELKERIKLHKSGEMSGIKTGLFDLDKLTNGWQKKDLIILAARPSMGKTALSLFFSKSAIIKDKSVCFFSLEMSDVKLSDRLLLSETDISPENYRSGTINDHELNQLEHISKKISKRKLFIDDVSGVDINYIKSVCRTKKRKNECDLIVIDYLQLINSTIKGSKNEKIEEISKKTKELAKELDVPVILLSQLSRDVEKRGGSKRPQLSDLRDSGAIEQDADMVIFVYRPSYYDDDEELVGKGELIISKHRNGELKNIPFKHNESLTQIYDYYNTQEPENLQPNINFDKPIKEQEEPYIDPF